MTDLKALIEKARARVQTPIAETINIVIGGEGEDAEFVPVEISKLAGHEWLTLKALHLPRPGVALDERIGCNIYAVATDYPADHLKVAGEEIAAEDWRDILAIVDAVHVENIVDLMLGLNVATSMLQVNELGKASAGDSEKKPNSPESSESHSDDSEGGSPQK